MTDNASPLVTHRAEGDIAVITLDDGKANALSFAMLDAVDAALDATTDARALVMAGRPGRFCAGFDLSVMESGPDGARQALARGAEIAMRVYEHPRPTVAAATGHALAMGAILLLAFDVRIGQPGAFKIGMNEINIGMPVPRFALELADDRLSRRHLHHATQLAQIFDPEGAVDAGYLDRLADDPVAAAITEADRLVGHVTTLGFETTRRYLRADRTAHMRANLAQDLAEFVVDPTR